MPSTNATRPTVGLVNAFGRRVRDVRRQRSLSTSELAEGAEITQRAVQYIERGQRVVRLDTLLALSAALSVKPNVLLRDLA
jgi:transcriptional regulator with XRE-family HTH domain